ncbi:hypothetical protein SAMN05892883_2477 [Jatrophihabitans sp. GAS493]|uniref:hypothetical protein n=1 Tax=Jatrophihabitans sp. GAS493 TaxID=1907575 RepID=UPI000BC08A99|nr:hypothetical protein [Jatrophihabitans sp. GAS493]SOD73188.1 hypothetical protein SAMN05892883_2477 [Jatrophihabitans sp. GAS493]
MKNSGMFADLDFQPKSAQLSAFGSPTVGADFGWRREARPGSDAMGFTRPADLRDMQAVACFAGVGTSIHEGTTVSGAGYGFTVTASRHASANATAAKSALIAPTMAAKRGAPPRGNRSLIT